MPFLLFRGRSSSHGGRLARGHEMREARSGIAAVLLRLPIVFLCLSLAWANNIIFALVAGAVSFFFMSFFSPTFAFFSVTVPNPRVR